MRTIIMAIIAFALAACEDPCAPRRDCLEERQEFLLVPISMGEDIHLQPLTFTECVRWGEPYIPEGCQKEKQ